MPHVDITMYPGRDNQTKAALAEKVQAFVAQELGLDRQFVSVSIEDVAKEKWEQHLKSFDADKMFVKPPQL